jgi:hypothetical protein
LIHSVALVLAPREFVAQGALHLFERSHALEHAGLQSRRRRWRMHLQHRPRCIHGEMRQPGLDGAKQDVPVLHGNVGAKRCVGESSARLLAFGAWR